MWLDRSQRLIPLSSSSSVDRQVLINVEASAISPDERQFGFIFTKIPFTRRSDEEKKKDQGAWTRSPVLSVCLRPPNFFAPAATDHNINSTVSDSMLMHVMLFESVSLAVVIEFSSLVLVKLQVSHILHTHAERVERQEFSLFTHTSSSQSERRRETGGNEERTAESSTSCQAACLLAINRHIQACCWVWVNMSAPKAFPSQNTRDERWEESHTEEMRGQTLFIWLTTTEKLNQIKAQTDSAGYYLQTRLYAVTDYMMSAAVSM